jgi:hypothetical protein
MKLGLGLSTLALTLLAGCDAKPGSTPMEAGGQAMPHRGAAAATPAPAGYDQQMKMMQDGMAMMG